MFTIIPPSELNHKPIDRKISIVIGSGGPKSFAAIPIIKFLRKHNIEIELIGGCSGGAIVSCALASGMSNNELDFFIQDFSDEIHKRGVFKKINLRGLLGLANYPFGRIDLHNGILKVEQLKLFFHKYFGNKSLEDLEIPTMLLATNYITGQGEILKTGSICSALMGSTSMCPIMPASNHLGQYYVDGGFHNDIPIIEMIKVAKGPILVMSFTEPFTKDYISFVHFMTQFVSAQAYNHSKHNIPLAISMHHEEILFINFIFEQMITLNTKGSLEIVMQKGEEVLSRYENEILAIFDRPT